VFPACAPSATTPLLESDANDWTRERIMEGGEGQNDPDRPDAGRARREDLG
jgi:hypothetical protein